MATWHLKLTAFLWRFVLFASVNAVDVFVLFQGIGLRLQTALIVLYRWTLYTPQPGDLIIFMIFGFFWDAIYHLPFGFHSFLMMTTFIVLQTQKRYLQVSHQYLRWLVFLGVLLLVNQVEYALHLLLGQQIILSSMLALSMFVTFSLYPFVFKFLQHYDR
jgi:cell shape-determining protein MreD